MTRYCGGVASTAAVSQSILIKVETRKKKKSTYWQIKEYHLNTLLQI